MLRVSPTFFSWLVKCRAYIESDGRNKEWSRRNRLYLICLKVLSTTTVSQEMQLPRIAATSTCSLAVRFSLQAFITSALSGDNRCVWECISVQESTECCLFSDSLSDPDYKASRGWIVVNHEFETIWKQAVMS
jgi:hypothetical protein